MPTGGGKTYGAILCMKELSVKDKKLIIVPTIYLQEQWKAELTKHKVVNWRVLVINTAIKFNHITDLLVLDEIHRYASVEFGKIKELVTFNSSKKVIGLTATLQRQDNRHFLLEEYCPVVYKVSVKEALKDNIIPEFIVYNLPVKLSDQEKFEYKRLDKNFGHFFGFFNNDFQEAMACLNSPSRRRAHSESTGVEEKTIHLAAINFAKAMRRRKDFLYKIPVKDDYVKEICDKFSDKKIITFSETIDTSKRLEKLISSSKCYHSKLPVKKKIKVMEDYKNDRLLVLHTARALDEGMDVSNIDIGVIHSSTSTKRQAVQRTGRLLRKDGEKIPIIINLYVGDVEGKPTQDKKWLIKRLEGMPNVYWINSIDEITYNTDNKLSEEIRSNLISERII